uniref:Class II aldolase/adducin N-terminal domain-containing protein n=1 Tax=uncultured alpha proteobacterium EF100_94H03 TaxID=710800 RepID=E0Y218_9PROT|nr:hypothetical protein [uncultured alpha proteobacterium EF100_94H03]
MAVSGLKAGLQLTSEPAFMFCDGLSYLDANFHFDDAYCNAVANTVGDGKATIYRNHAFATLGKNAAEAMLRADRLNQACEIQLRMQAAGGAVLQPSDDELAAHYDAF